MIKSLRHSEIKGHLSQLLSYGAIGIVVNVLSYVIYLLVTYFGGTPKITMSVLYVLTAFVSFIGNKRLTFSYKGDFFGSGLRFSIAHFFGYLINLCLLYVLVDKFGHPHQFVQILAIFIVAAFLFFTFKFFVFRKM